MFDPDTRFEERFTLQASVPGVYLKIPMKVVVEDCSANTLSAEYNEVPIQTKLRLNAELEKEGEGFRFDLFDKIKFTSAVPGCAISKVQVDTITASSYRHFATNPLRLFSSAEPQFNLKFPADRDELYNFQVKGSTDIIGSSENQEASFELELFICGEERFKVRDAA